MSSNEKAIPFTGAKGNQIIKPPGNLWAALEEVRAAQDIDPPCNAFSITDYRAKFGIITYQKAATEVERLETAGKLRKVGRFGPRKQKYYVLIEGK